MKHGHVAIMQPYIFPYLGYFHLIEASDLFVFYDDVNYIKRGWINRNRIVLQQEPHLFTIPIKQASQNIYIKDTLTSLDQKWLNKFNTQLTQTYKKAPHFNPVMELIQASFNERPDQSIADLAIRTIKLIYQYLDHDIRFTRSSDISPMTRGMDKADRLIQITKELNYSSYLNAIGGKELYDKAYFKAQGVDLHFVKSKEKHYSQFNHPFIPELSIIDVLMFNDKDDTRALFSQFQLI